MKVWEVREGADKHQYSKGIHRNSEYDETKKSEDELIDAYECGYEEGYEEGYAEAKKKLMYSRIKSR